MTPRFTGRRPDVLLAPRCCILIPASCPSLPSLEGSEDSNLDRNFVMHRDPSETRTRTLQIENLASTPLDRGALRPALCPTELPFLPALALGVDR